MGVHYSAPISSADVLVAGSPGAHYDVYAFNLRRTNALQQERFLASLLVPDAVLYFQSRALDGNGRFSVWSAPQVISVKPCQ
jgi:hypothetical protein